MEIVCKWMFLLVLCVASWQDMRNKMIENRLLWGAGMVGFLCWVNSGRGISDLVISCGIGGILLGISILTEGGIGEGDGWFFVVSGLYLHWRENVCLLLSAMLLCFIWSFPFVIMTVIRRGAGRKKSLPFLPFLIPAGIWMVIH